jgi:hypothetical protein
MPYTTCTTSHTLHHLHYSTHPTPPVLQHTPHTPCTTCTTSHIHPRTYPTSFSPPTPAAQQHHASPSPIRYPHPDSGSAVTTKAPTRETNHGLPPPTPPPPPPPHLPPYTTCAATTANSALLPAPHTPNHLYAHHTRAVTRHPRPYAAHVLEPGVSLLSANAKERLSVDGKPNISRAAERGTTSSPQAQQVPLCFPTHQ